MRIAVVHNGNHEGVIDRFGRPCPERYSLRHVQNVVDGLRQHGHLAALLEADIFLFDQLRRFLQVEPTSPVPMPFADSNGPRQHLPPGMVFNMAYGIQGDARYTHLPAMLELAGIPYTGANPLGHALALDKVITKVLMLDAGVPTPAYRVMSAAGEDLRDLAFPLVIKPRYESTSYGIRLVYDRSQLDSAVEAVVEEYQQEALVEEYIDGREVCIGLLGNEPMEFLPPMELDFTGRGLRLMTWDDKYHKRTDEPRKLCPAPIESALTLELNDMALATFRACHVRDYARVDIRIDPAGRPFALEINSMPSLGDGGSYVSAAKVAGYDLASLVNRVVDLAHARYFGPSSARAVLSAAT